MTQYNIGAAWQTPDLPEPTEDEQALAAFLRGETDEVDPSALRARLAQTERRCAILEENIRSVAERMQEYAAEDMSSADMPTRVTEQYIAGFVSGRLEAMSAAVQLVRDVINVAAEGA